MEAVGQVWRKSSHSGNGGVECVEVSVQRGAGVVAVRDSKDPQGGVLAISPDRWKAFTGAVRRGDYA